MRRLSGLLTLAVILLSNPSFAGEALVLWKEGPISLHRKASSTKAQVSVGTALEAGDRLQLSPAAKVSIRYPDGRIDLISSAKEYVVGKMGNLQATRGLPGEENPFHHQGKHLRELLFSGQVLRGEEGALSPRGHVLSTRPAFVWVSLTDKGPFYLTLGSKDGPLWKGKAVEALKALKSDGQYWILVMDYPQEAPELRRGERYYWKVEGGALLRTSFYVLEPGEAKTVEEEIAHYLSGCEDKTTSMNVRATVLKERRLFGEAAHGFLHLETRYPEESYPCQALSILFAELGFLKLAQAEAACGEGK
ncbi:MAG: hypothetical protein SWE60_05310 [Thermodesulfobacteriota bacterium]|nr:hypothetical protein [Thermodesulfobacteriota bacterium]